MARIKQITVGNTNYDIQSIEYLVGTQTSSTNVWKATTVSSALDAGKVIAYKLPYAGTSTAATMTLTFSGGGNSGAKNIMMNGTDSVTDQFPANSIILMMYDGTNWQVLGGGAQIELATTSESFVKTVTPSTANISYNEGTLTIGSTVMVTGLDSTSGSAITAVDSDANIANAYGVSF